MDHIKIVSKNRKAGFEYFLIEKFEAGIELHGSEIKSIRAGQVSIGEAFVQIENFEAWLMNSHIAPYSQASIFNHEPKRKRKLLLHKKEINHIWNSVKQKGMTIVPTMLYLKEDGKAKIEIALAKGKKLYDKRDRIAKRDQDREASRIRKDFD
jgi:SsrA-binding protein